MFEHLHFSFTYSCLFCRRCAEPRLGCLFVIIVFSSCFSFLCLCSSFCHPDALLPSQFLVPFVLFSCYPHSLFLLVPLSYSCLLVSFHLHFSHYIYLLRNHLCSFFRGSGLTFALSIDLQPHACPDGSELACFNSNSSQYITQFFLRRLGSGAGKSLCTQIHFVFRPIRLSIWSFRISRCCFIDRVPTQLNSSIFVHFRYIVRIFLPLLFVLVLTMVLTLYMCRPLCCFSKLAFSFLILIFPFG